MTKQTFERVEEKFLLSPAQYRAIQAGLRGRMQPDLFGRSMISSIYYDTDDYRLIRTSLAKPDYKEKLRLRGYGALTQESTVYAELKKKVDGVVYKRREPLTMGEANALLRGESFRAESQVMREIQYFLRFYEAKPRVFLSYRRVAYTGADEGLRITFDDTVSYRTGALSLGAGAWGQELLPPGMTLMEIKAPGAMPLWLCKLLSEQEIYPTSFSKYGMCYREFIAPHVQPAKKGQMIYA